MIKSLWQMLLTEHEQIWATTLVHIKISLIALLIAMVIAIPLAFILKGHKKAAEFTLQIAGIIQTIPSLAVLSVYSLPLQRLLRLKVLPLKDFRLNLH